jgi:hypothetical protein
VSEEQVEIRTAAAQARRHLLRLASEDGVLQQIESGVWNDRLPDYGADMRDLLDAMAERARLDRIILDRFASAN